MKQNPALAWLVSLIAVLAIVTAGMGFFSQGGDSPFHSSQVVSFEARMLSPYL